MRELAKGNYQAKFSSNVPLLPSKPKKKAEMQARKKIKKLQTAQNAFGNKSKHKHKHKQNKNKNKNKSQGVSQQCSKSIWQLLLTLSDEWRPHL